jgi:lysozyme family protein
MRTPCRLVQNETLGSVAKAIVVFSVREDGVVGPATLLAVRAQAKPSLVGRDGLGCFRRLAKVHQLALTEFS